MNEFETILKRAIKIQQRIYKSRLHFNKEVYVFFVRLLAKKTGRLPFLPHLEEICFIDLNSKRFREVLEFTWRVMTDNEMDMQQMNARIVCDITKFCCNKNYKFWM